MMNLTQLRNQGILLDDFQNGSRQPFSKVNKALGMSLESNTLYFSIEKKNETRWKASVTSCSVFENKYILFYIVI